jgi:hypothetical protein
MRTEGTGFKITGNQGSQRPKKTGARKLFGKVEVIGYSEE